MPADEPAAKYDGKAGVTATTTAPDQPMVPPAENLGVTLSRGLTPSQRRRQELSLTIPLSLRVEDAYTNFSLLKTANSIVDAAAIEADNAIAGIEPEYLRVTGRLALVIGQSLVAANANVYSHEWGHIGEANDLGLDGHLESFRFLEGRYRYRNPATPGEDFEASLGGLNQSSFNAVHLWRDSAVRGERTLGEALAYLPAKLDDTQYIINKGDDLNPVYDPVRIRNHLRDLGLEIDTRHMLTKSLVADLVSPATWGSLAQIGKYVATGERAAELEVWRLGNLEGYWPNVELIRSIKGDNFRIDTMLNPDHDHPVALRIDIRTDLNDWDVNAAAVRATANNLLELGSVTFSPWVGAYTPIGKNDMDEMVRGLSPEAKEFYLGPHFADPEEPGFELGTDVRLDLGNGWALEGTVGYGRIGRNGDLASEVHARGFITYRWGR